MSSMSEPLLPVLSLHETRVLGVLAEKQFTGPDYPLSLNWLVAGCNQKNGRDPVLSITGPEVQTAIERLTGLALVAEASGQRVTRYEHKLDSLLQLSKPSLAILTTIMLRGQQTPEELRINCERLHKFGDAASVEAVLNALKDRPEGALVYAVPVKAGGDESRWMHLLSGPPPVEAVPIPSAVPAAPDVIQADAAPAVAVAEAPSVPSVTPTPVEGANTAREIATLKANVARLEDDVAELKMALAKISRGLGITKPK